MSYVRKIIAKDEELIGIARLHWIYIMKGLAWFVAMAGFGWLADALITRGMMYVGGVTNTYAIPAAFMTISNGMMMFMVVGGFFVFFLFVLKVLVTEIGLSNRRVIEKTGLIFVKVRQIDLEEIRGENMDMGYLGRVLGYAYILLDCRFIGDVRLPAVENPERFIRALHTLRAKTQDALSIVMGKGNAIPVGEALAPPPDGEQSLQMQTPEPPQPIVPDDRPSPAVPEQPPQPAPEIAPPGPPQPEIQPSPVPHTTPQPQPNVPPQPTTPQPVQPIPAPGPNPQPPLQPPGNPTGQQAAAQLDPKTVAQVVQQVTPQIAQQVVKEMAEQGLLKETPEPANDVDKLTASFDDALTKKGARGHDPDNKMEYAVH